MLKKKVSRFTLVILLGMIMVIFVACSQTKSGGNASGQSPVKIGVLAAKTGPVEDYAKQSLRGVELGFDYATKGTMTVAGHPIQIIVEDTEMKPNVAVQKATKLLEEDKVDFLIGSQSSGDTLAVIPLLKEYKKIMVVDPAGADSITGADWNKYVFHTARNSSMDAIAAAAAIAKKDVKIATFAPDNAFGHQAMAAFKPSAEKLGAQIVVQQFADPAATDYTANIQKIITAKPDYVYVVWAGAANTPWKQLSDMQVQKQGIKISAVVPSIAELKMMNDLVGLVGFADYFYTLPQNDVNKWLVEEHKKRFNGEVPDSKTPGSMSAAIAIVEAIKKTNGDLDTDKLITAMEGMSFEGAKGTVKFRAEDHQALQKLFAIRLEKKEGLDYPIPVLIREMSPEELVPPIKNKR